MTQASAIGASSALRIVFAGTPDFAALHLEALLSSAHQVAAVYTQPDRPAGRGKKLQASPVKRLAQSHAIPVFQPVSLRDEQARQTLAELEPDLLVVVAYGLILPQAILDTPRFGCLNVHASLLPRWRGAAPIQRAIEAGDASSGVTIMQMDAGLDTGAMLASASCELGPRTNAADLHDSLAQLGAPLLLEVLQDLPAHQRGAAVQNDEAACYAAKILKSEAQIDWRLDAEALDRAVRAFNPFPVCFSTLDGERVKIWDARPEVAAKSTGPVAAPGSAPAGTIVRADKDGIAVNCGAGRLLISRLQLPGGKILTAQQLLHARGEHFAPGKRFELPAGNTD